MKAYKVNEIFYSVQGEGFHSGTPAVFLRLSGCNLRCPFCDTNHSAHTLMTANQIAAEMTRHPSRHAVITGGEPMLQLDAELVEALRQAGFFLQVETNGTICPNGFTVDWLTVSPKGELASIAVANPQELKVVYQRQSLAHYKPLAAKAGAGHCFLQPCHYARNPQATARSIADTVAAVKANPEWRLSLQTHKLIDIP